LRRPLTLIALALMMLGIEIATGAVSVAVVRLGGGLSAVLSGDEYVISMPRYVIGLAIVLTGAAVAVGVLWAEIERRTILTDGSGCPKCGTPTKRVKRRARHRILSRILETHVTRRRCERCGWNGLAA
jgi:hypothetical protein